MDSKVEEDWLSKIFASKAQYWQESYERRYLPTWVAVIDSPNLEAEEKLLANYSVDASDAHVQDEWVKEHIDQFITVLDEDTKCTFVPMFYCELNDPMSLLVEDKAAYLMVQATIGTKSERVLIELQLDTLDDKSLAASVCKELIQVITQNFMWPPQLSPYSIVLEQTCTVGLVDAIKESVKHRFSKVKCLFSKIGYQRKYVTLDGKCLKCDTSVPLHLMFGERWIESSSQASLKTESPRRNQLVSSLIEEITEESIGLSLPFQSVAREDQLWTIDGWNACMTHSNMFPFPFPPSCGFLCQQILMSVVWNRACLSLKPGCLEKVGESRVLMLIFRLLTFLRRDREVLSLLLFQTPLSNEHAGATFSYKDLDQVICAELDVQSWIALLVWICETCSPKTFCIALACVPPKHIFSVASALENILANQENFVANRVTSLYSYALAFEYVCGSKHSKSLEQKMIKKKSHLMLNERGTKKFLESVSRQRCRVQIHQLRQAKLIVDFFKELHKSFEVSQPLLIKRFVSRAWVRMQTMMQFEDDELFSYGRTLLLHQCEHQRAQSWSIKDLALLELRSPRTLQMTRIWSVVNTSQISVTLLFQLQQECPDLSVIMTDRFTSMTSRDEHVDCMGSSFLIRKVVQFLLYPKDHAESLLEWTRRVAVQLNDSKHTLESALTCLKSAYDELRDSLEEEEQAGYKSLKYLQ